MNYSFILIGFILDIILFILFIYLYSRYIKKLENDIKCGEYKVRYWRTRLMNLKGKENEDK